MFKKRIVIVLMVIVAVALSGGLINVYADNEPETFKIATVRWADWGTDFLKGFIEQSEQNANIDVDWEVYVNSDWADKKAVLMAGGDLPDAFLGSICFNDAEIAQNYGAFIPLENLIEKNMPNLMAAFQDDPKLRAMVTSPDGHIYNLPKKLPNRPITGNQVFINQQWLDNLGLKMPDTYQDFYNVLKAFKEEDANGNGDPNDEIPYGPGNVDPVYSFLLPFGTTYSTGAYPMVVRDDKAVFVPTMDSYHQGIKWMHKAYDDGLIDPELFTESSSMSDAKRKNADVSLVGVSAGWTPDAVFGPNADEYAALYPLKGPDGNRYVFSNPDRYNYSRNEFLITRNCKDPAALLRWVDQFYTEDASIQNFYGSFGIGVKKNDDGSYTVLTPPEGQSADLFAWVHSLRDFGPKYVSVGFNKKVKLPVDAGDGLKLKLDKEINQFAIPGFPNVMYTKDELNRLSALYTDIGSYISTMQAKWVVDGGIDNDWDKYITTLKQMGYDEFMKIQQAAYDRYENALQQ